MKTFIGTKIVKAKPMNRQEYNDLRGWEVPKDENPDDAGYLIECLNSDSKNHPDYENYISWSPKENFERDYQAVNKLTFGQAIEALKKGQKVARDGWNGKGMFLYYVPANKYPASRNTLATMKGQFPDDLVPYAAYIAMKTAQNNVVPWLASQTDVLSEDWVVVEDK